MEVGLIEVGPLRESDNDGVRAVRCPPSAVAAGVEVDFNCDGWRGEVTMRVLGRRTAKPVVDVAARPPTPSPAETEEGGGARWIFASAASATAASAPVVVPA